MYGWQTKSWRNSTENRQMKAERKKFTEAVKRGEIKLAMALIPVWCNCRSFDMPHDPRRHDELPGGDLDWRTPEERRGMQVFPERVR